MDLNLAQVIPDEVLKILSTKQEEWNYEEEIRIIQNSDYYDINGRIRRVICGSRMAPSMYQAISVICETRQIPVSMMHIDHEGIDITGERNLAIRLAEAFKQTSDTQPGDSDNA